MHRPPAIDYPEMPDDQFGDWLGTLIDAAGWFSAYPDHHGRVYPQFRLQVSDRDWVTLEVIRERVGFGTIRRSSSPLAPTRADGTRVKDSVIYNVGDLPAKVHFVHYLDEYTLLSGKYNEYAIWRRVVLAQAAGEPTRDLMRFVQPLRDAQACIPTPDLLPSLA